MQKILKFEHRYNLYTFLIQDFGMIKIREIYDPDVFGNFYVTLEARDFYLNYINDRSFLTITITSKFDSSTDFDLSFVRDFIYDPENINSSEGDEDNLKRILELNKFVKSDFCKISELFESENYFKTKEQIEHLLKEQFKKRNPGLLK